MSGCAEKERLRLIHTTFRAYKYPPWLALQFIRPFCSTSSVWTFEGQVENLFWAYYALGLVLARVYQGCGALVCGRTLQCEWVKTHIDTYYFFRIAWLFYIPNMHVYYSHEIYFWLLCTLFCEKEWRITR